MVSTSLFTGLSGLRANQRYIDVVGNNLSNVSTPGFRSSRITFGDILNFTMRSGSGPSANFGGQNPMQVGLGAQIASIDVNTRQGTFQDTGREFDLALQGRGFFTLADGSQNYYTRVGTFGVDSQRNLVDLRTGYRVINSSGANISIPLTDTLPPQSTSEITFQGNLPAAVTGPLEEILESASPFLAGTAAQKSATPPSGTTYDLTGFTAAPNNTLRVAVNGGAEQSVQFTAGAFTNVAAATSTEIAALFASVTGLSVTPDAGTGAITVDTVAIGSSATLKFDNGSGASGLLQALGMDAALASGTETAADATTDLRNLTFRVAPYANGDSILVNGTNPDGTAVSDTFVYGTNGTTLGALRDFINMTYDSNQVVATIETTGALRMTATQKQAADLTMAISDAKSNQGSSAYPVLAVSQEGAGPDTAVTSIDVFDSLGRTHSVTMTFTRSTADPATWDLSAAMDPSSGTITNNTVASIQFNQDGSFNVIAGGNSTIDFLFNGQTSGQAVSINLGSNGQFNGVSMVGSNTSVAATEQNGFASGTLLNVAFEGNGNLQGFYSNGQTRLLDELRITMFQNEAGLLRAGDTLFTESPNTAEAIATTAGSAGAGIVRTGSLENSNVDIAEEFVQLITAQRGFQANARVITTADEILAELVNIVR